MNAIFIRVFLLGLLCACARPLHGTWDVEMQDVDDCDGELDLTQRGDDIEGSAELSCVVNVSDEYGNFAYTHLFESDDVDVDGRIDGDEFELTLEWEDDDFGDIELELLGEIDGDDMEGDAELLGGEFGEFEGERS